MLDLTDDEKQALIRLLREKLEYDRYPMAPRLDPLKAILGQARPATAAARAIAADPIRHDPGASAREVATVMLPWP